MAIRNSPTSIDVFEEDGPLLLLGPQDMFRTIPFAAGDVVDVAGMRATVVRVDPKGQPTAVHYEFDQNLDSPDVAWISEGRSGFSEVVPLRLGSGSAWRPD